MTVTSWDDYPVHQASQWIAHTATSDRNFYDRYYFNAFDTSGAWMAIVGLGQYPNLGTTDAFITVRLGDQQRVVRASKPLVDRADISVGPLRVEVLEPLKRLRFVTEPNEHGITCNLVWEGFGPAIPEPPQFIRSFGRVTFDTQRLAQMGSWSGTLTVDGQDLNVDPATTWGSRDRSWGVRPVGEKEPEGIRQGVNAMGGGMWSYFPMRFEDHCIFYICSERADGTRTLEQADRVWLDGRIESLGRTDHAHTFVSGFRELAGSTISFLDAGFEVTCTPLLANYLALGTGYGLEQDWRHGMYQGPDVVVQGVTYQVPEIRAIGNYAVTDHAARFEYDGHVGYGLYEHSFSGSMPKYGLE
jgi:hypothetical protein